TVNNEKSRAIFCDPKNNPLPGCAANGSGAVKPSIRTFDQLGGWVRRRLGRDPKRSQPAKDRGSGYESTTGQERYGQYDMHAELHATWTRVTVTMLENEIVCD